MIEIQCQYCGCILKVYPSDNRKFCSRKCRGLSGELRQPMADATKQKIGAANKGRVRTYAEKQALSLAHKGQIAWFRGLNRSPMTGKQHSLASRQKTSDAHKRLVALGTHHLWKGGITAVNRAARESFEYHEWRKQVYKRDKVCVQCGSKKELQADHIKPFALFPELRYDVNNGRILCKPCHKKTDTYGYSKMYMKDELQAEKYRV